MRGQILNRKRSNGFQAFFPGNSDDNPYFIQDTLFLYEKLLIRPSEEVSVETAGGATLGHAEDD